ncbi:MAG: amidohydrolase family protein [Promethearchaeota archaeon]
MDLNKNLRVFDAHMHFNGIFKDPNIDLIKYLDENSIDKAIVNTLNKEANMDVLKKLDIEELKQISTNTNALRKIDIFKSFKEYGQPDHRMLESLRKKAPNRIFPLFWYNPVDLNDKDQEKGLKIVKDKLENGFYGVKIHLAMHNCEIERLFPVADLVIKHDKIMYIHPSAGVFSAKRTNPFDLIKLSKKFPNLKLVIGHCAYSMEFVIEMVAAVKSLYEKGRNIYFETSVSIPFGIISYLKVFGADRILFGSDSPPAGPWHIEYKKIVNLKIPNDMKQKILYTNTAKLLKIE